MSALARRAGEAMLRDGPGRLIRFDHVQPDASGEEGAEGLEGLRRVHEHDHSGNRLEPVGLA